MDLKKLKIFSHDLSVFADGRLFKMSREIWDSIGIDDHIDVVLYDAAAGQGEIQWCAHPVTSRKPVNEKFTLSDSRYFDGATLTRVIAACARVDAEEKALAAAKAHQTQAAADAKAATLKAETEKAFVPGTIKVGG
jgi:hypothetical protein